MNTEQQIKSESRTAVHAKAVAAVRAAREAWVADRSWLGTPRTVDMCNLLDRCAAELGDKEPVTARLAKAGPMYRITLDAWLAMDEWRRAKGTE